MRLFNTKTRHKRNDSVSFILFWCWNSNQTLACSCAPQPFFFSSFSSFQIHLSVTRGSQLVCRFSGVLPRLRQELEFEASWGYVESHFRKANKPNNAKTSLSTSLASQHENSQQKEQACLKLFIKLFSQLSFRD